MNKIQMMTCLGENTVPILSEIGLELTDRIGIEFAFDPKPESTPAADKLVRGDVQMGWICGLLYVMLIDEKQAPLDLLGAPVFSGSNVPDYFSYLIVPHDSPADSFADLRGASIAINETTSWSGYHLLRADLCDRGLDMGYFGKVIESGAHSKSMGLVAKGEADSATIDHGVFEFVEAEQPKLMEQIKVIGRIGPSPSPPFVVNRDVPAELKRRIEAELLAMGQDEGFLSRVRPHRLDGIVPIGDGDYGSIRDGFRNSLALP